jgi:hypothetical protein
LVEGPRDEKGVAGGQLRTVDDEGNRKDSGMDTDGPDEVATAAAANSRDNYGGRLKAKPLVCTTAKPGVDMLKKSKPACTASSPSVALFDRNPKRFFPIFDDHKTCRNKTGQSSRKQSSTHRTKCKRND